MSVVGKCPSSVIWAGALMALVSSALGAEWVPTPTPPWRPRFDFPAVVYQDRMWVFGGELASGTIGDLWSSADGVQWTSHVANPLRLPLRRSGHAVLPYKGKMWLLGGLESFAMNDIWYSTNPSTWTRAVIHANWPPRFYHAAAVYNDKMWVMGGIYDTMKPPLADVWCSSDRVNWTSATLDAPWRGVYGVPALVFDNKLWLMAMRACYTTDGATWTMAGGPANRAWTGIGATVCDGRMWMMGGRDWLDNTSTAEVWSSPDGFRWTRVSSLAWPPRESVGAVALNGRIWVMGGIMYYGYHGGYAAFLNDVWSFRPPPTAVPRWSYYR